MRRRGSEVYTHVRSFVSVYNKSAPVRCVDAWPARSTTAMSTRRAPRSTHESTRGGCAEKKNVRPVSATGSRASRYSVSAALRALLQRGPQASGALLVLGVLQLSDAAAQNTPAHPRPLHRSHLPTVLSNSIIAALTCLRTVSRFTPRSVSVFCRHRKVSCSIALVLQSILGGSTGRTRAGRRE